MQIFAQLIAEQLSFNTAQVCSVIHLLNEGATIPFISRYRKEMTGNMDEVQVGRITQELKRLKKLSKRKETILETIRIQNKLDHELEQKIAGCWQSTVLEDLYLPYKPRRKTRAGAAREKGLEPLAGTLMKQEVMHIDEWVQRFVKGAVTDVDDALAGARDIMAEWMTERQTARNVLRKVFSHTAILQSRFTGNGKEEEKEAQKFKDYFDFSEPLKRTPGHRLLALFRGEKEGVLKITLQPDEKQAMERLERLFVKNRGPAGKQVALAVKEAYKRLLKPSIETEFRNAAKEKADTEAIRVFGKNLHQLLMAPPLGEKNILAIDPGFRTGCKVVCIDRQGNLRYNETIYPHAPQRQMHKAASKISGLIQAYRIEAIAIGNGTAGRETEDFIQQKVHLPPQLDVFMVNEAGASIYSASSVAREEFPDYDTTVRGAVSIGRRLMDPLAELVKIDAKSIGVGQYQHDVDQNRLKEELEMMVTSAVNRVGVNLNTASKHLLTFVSGLGPKLAKNIIEHRKKAGPFASRKALLKVTGLGPKAYEQAAGFLRIPNAEDPLDASAVHPERYALVAKMAKAVNLSPAALMVSPEQTDRIDLNAFIKTDVGLPTLLDIVKELKKPGRDPRGKASAFSFSREVCKIEDLREGMVLPGIVTNITNFGAFVNIGVKQDGLVHVSVMADKFIRDPNEVVRLSQHVQVMVTQVDVQRKRIGLSMKGLNP